MLVAVYFVGACTWLPNQVGMEILAQKVGAYGPCISLKCYHICNKLLECYYHKYTILDASICF